MSHSGWETRVVAESVGGCIHPSIGLKFRCVQCLEAEAAGMRRALERCRGYVSGVGNPHKEDVEKALSGDAGKEILREMGRLKDTINLKDVALQSAIGGLKASKIEIELVQNDLDHAKAVIEADKKHFHALTVERDRLKIETEMAQLERNDARDALDREQKKNLQERKDLTELYAAKLAEVTRESDEAKANECRLSQSFADTFSKVAVHEEGLRERAKKAESQLETAQKELAELNNRDSEAKAECIRIMEESIRELETAQRQADWLLWASRRVRDGYPQEARGTYYEDLCTVIRVVESGLAGRDYVHKDEVEKAVERIKTLEKALADVRVTANKGMIAQAVEAEREECAKMFQCTHCQEAIRARGGK